MPAAPKLSVSKLDRAEQDLYLLQHVPHRLCAAATWLDLPGKWAMPPSPRLPNDHFHVWCICRAVDEGHYASMRWLIEFVGIRMATNHSKPTRPTPYKVADPMKAKKAADELVSIKRFKGGRYFPKRRGGSALLAKIWKGCSQASMHPTRDTDHPDVSPPRLARALVLILNHLERHLYASNGLNLLNVIRTQELRSNIRRRHPGKD